MHNGKIIIFSRVTTRTDLYENVLGDTGMKKTRAQTKVLKMMTWVRKVKVESKTIITETDRKCYLELLKLV